MKKTLWNLNRLILTNIKTNKNRIDLKCLLLNRTPGSVTLRLINTTRPNLTNVNRKNLRVFNFIYTTLEYAFVFSVTASLGLITGYYLIDRGGNGKKVEFQATRIVENKKKEFPLRLHLYQYESDAACTHIRTYLDYFGYEYKLTEVDPIAKNEQLAFTLNRKLPVLVVQNRDNKQRWHLANSTAIISALESIRNEENRLNFADILNKYLPVLKGNQVQATMNPFKYHVTNSDLNSVEWRRWIDEEAQAIIHLNAISKIESILELFNIYSLKSNWNQRYENKLKYYYVYYLNVFKTYMNSNQLRSNLKLNTNNNEIYQLENVIKKWETGLGEKNFIGGSEPNLADLTMYANVKSYEETNFMRKYLNQTNQKFSKWFQLMKQKIESGYTEKAILIKHDEPFVNNDKEEISQPITNQSNTNNNQFEASKILATIYLVHVGVFTYAAYMASK